MAATLSRLRALLPAPLQLGFGAAAVGCALLIGGLPLPWAFGLLLAGAALIGMLIDPAVGLCLAVASIPLQELVPLPLDLTVTHVMGGLALGAWLLGSLGRRELRIERELLLPWTLFLLVLLLASGLTPYNAVDALKQTMRWILAFLAFAIALATLTTPRRAAWLIATILLAASLESLVGLRQFLSGDGPESFEVGAFVRAYGTIGKPNTFAGYLELAWPLGAALTVALAQRWWRQPRQPLLLGALAGSAAATLICLAGIGASYSRGAWLGSLAAGAAMIALEERRRVVPLLALLAALGGVVVFKPELLPASVAERATSITKNFQIFDAGRVTVTDDNFAVVERMAHWQAGAGMFLDRPWLGVGPGNFNLAYPRYFVGRWSESQGHAHNYYIHIAAEAGLPGLLAYLLLIGAVAATGLRAARATRGTAWHAAAIGGCGIIAAVLVHNLFENLHVLNFGIHMSAVWGLLAVLATRRGWQNA